jgi:DMSO/TMAO reductase YedYZ molybdopterin-dependent catalytic subunit
VSRRQLLGVGALAAAGVTIATLSDRVSFFEPVSVLAQRSGDGPQGVPVNRSAAAAGVTAGALAPDWVLTVVAGGRQARLSLADLEALPQTTARLPIACVEGWSREAEWTGVSLPDLLRSVGAGMGDGVRAISLDPSLYGRSYLPPHVAEDELALIALRLNGAPLHLDHGFPARIIAPARPGVLQTKWLTRIEVDG